MSKRGCYFTENSMMPQCRALWDRMEAEEARADKLAVAWTEARKTLPPDRDLNKPWSQAIAIMEEALASTGEQALAEREALEDLALAQLDAARGK